MNLRTSGKKTMARTREFKSSIGTELERLLEAAGDLAYRGQIPEGPGLGPWSKRLRPKGRVDYKPMMK
jgi:hypothetical protein